MTTPKKDTPKETNGGDITTPAGVPILKTPPPLPRDDEQSLTPPPPAAAVGPVRASLYAHRPTASERNAYIQAMANDYAHSRATEMRLRGAVVDGVAPLIPRDEAFQASCDAHRAYFGLDASTYVLPFRLFKHSDYVPFCPVAAARGSQGGRRPNVVSTDVKNLESS